MGGGKPIRFVRLIGFLLVVASAIQAAAQHYEHPLPDDFNEPIRLYTTGLGTFTRPISSSHAEAQAVLQPGLSADVRLRQGRGRAILSRGADAGSRLRDLLLGRSVGVGAVRQRAHDGGACCAEAETRPSGKRPRWPIGTRTRKSNG